MAPSLLAVTATLLIVLLPLACGLAVQTPEDAADTSRAELLAPRTFGRMRIMKSVMLPMVFLLGGIKMLLMFLTVIALKTLFIAATILVINISVGLAKVINFFKHGQNLGHGHSYGGGGSWPSAQEKNININIHSDPGHTLSLDGQPLPTIHSSIAPTYPYSRSDLLEPVYSSLSPSLAQHYSKLFSSPTSRPYSHWPQVTRR